MDVLGGGRLLPAGLVLSMAVLVGGARHGDGVAAGLEHGWGRAVVGAELSAAGPQIEFATFLGGSAAEELREVIVDVDGSILVGGSSASADYPTTPGAVQTTYGGEPPGTCNPGICGGDMVVTRLAPDGASLRSSTFLGGSKQERNVYGMALDRGGQVVVTTSTRSSDMPTTDSALQEAYGGGDSDMVVAKLSADLDALLWCTYLGGTAGESPRGGLALDEQDRVYVVGPSASADFPTSPGAYRRSPLGGEDAVIAALEADGTALYASTRLGGSGADGIMGAVFDDAGGVHVLGHTDSLDLPATAGAAQRQSGGASDAYVAGLAHDLTALLYAGYLGGAANEWAEHRPSWLPSDGLLLTGVTASAGFPVTPGVVQSAMRGQNDGFLSKVSSTDGALLFSTFVGGSGTEFFLMPSPDADGAIYMVGNTTSTDFPVTADARQPMFGGGAGDGVLVKVAEDGSRILYATYLGGSGDDLIRGIAVLPGGEVVLVGRTSSADFPVTAGSFQRRLAGGFDGFVVRMAPGGGSGSATPTAPAGPTPTPVDAVGGTAFLPVAARP